MIDRRRDTAVHRDGPPNTLDRARSASTGKSVRGVSGVRVQPLLQKYFCFSETQIRCINIAVPPEKGRFAIVTNAGWDAVDAGSVRRAFKRAGRKR
jgi:hypothetical protein